MSKLHDRLAAPADKKPNNSYTYKLIHNKHFINCSINGFYIDNSTNTPITLTINWQSNQVCIRLCISSNDNKWISSHIRFRFRINFRVVLTLRYFVFFINISKLRKCPHKQQYCATRNLFPKTVSILTSVKNCAT